MAKKRVMFAWLKSKTGCKVKAYIAFLGDNLDWESVLEKKISRKKIFNEEILPKVVKKYPKMYNIVMRYYLKNGRKLTREEFENLLYLRFQNLFDVDIKNHIWKRSSEHPLNAKHEKLTSNYRMLKKNG